MMAGIIHHIHITIEEFIKNGGKLEKGRAIYIPEREWANLSYKYVADYMEFDGEHHIVKGGGASHPISTMLGYVRIKVTPVYE